MAKTEITGSVQPKNGMYYAVLNLKDEKGKRKPKWIPTDLPVRGNKMKAKEVLKQLLQEYNEKAQSQTASDIGMKSVDFMVYLRAWLNKKRGSLQDLTYDTYKTLIEGKINRHFTPLGLMLQEITADHIEEFFQHLYDEELTSATVLHYYAVLKTAFRDAMRKKNKLISINPMDDVDRPSGSDFRASFYSTQEVHNLLAVANDDPLYTIIVIATYYGLRRSEILGIKWNAIDFENNVITIRHKIYLTKNDGNRRVLKGSDKMKTKASLRSFPLIPFVKETLLFEKQKQMEYQRVFKGAYDRTHLEYICVWPDGRLINPDYVSRHFPVILKQHELRSIRFHDLRHTCASLLVAAGIPMKMIQEWLGHSVFQTTANLYSHLEQRAKEGVAEVLAVQLSTGIMGDTSMIGPELTT